MCIYIFSPGKTIEIEYASETITLLAKYGDTNRPSTEVVIDFLIKNPSKKDKIEELYIIYPRAFYSVSIKDNEFEKLKTCDIIDQTSTFTSPDHYFNRLLNDIPCDMNISKVDNRLKMILDQPDPNSPGKTTRYEGYLFKNKKEIELYDKITKIQLFILMNLSKSFTIFRIQCDQAINPEECQWMRWFITEPTANFSPRNFFRHWKDKALDRLTANYHIWGSYDVLYQIKSYLKAFIMGKPTTETEAYRKLNSEAKNLLNLLEELTSNSKVIIKDWRIHVFPKEYWELSDINTYGDIKPAGNFPNILDPYPLRNGYEIELVYQWKTGEKYIPANEQILDGKFHISAIVKDSNYMYRLLPWIALILATIAFFNSL